MTGGPALPRRVVDRPDHPQRLVRTSVRTAVLEPIDEEWTAKLKEVGMTPDDLGGEIAYGPGCDECFQSGYAGGPRSTNSCR